MLPLFPKKLKAESLLTPEQFLQSMGTLKPLASDTVLMVYHETFLHGLKEHPNFQNQVAKSIGIGAPAAVAHLEELKAKGLKRVITLGLAGGLMPEYAIGQVLWVDSALRDEGTSYHYLEKDRPAVASEKLKAEFIKKLAWPMVKAWTTDAPYRETKEELIHYRKQKIACVEMEIAAVYAWAEYRKVEALSAVVISDLLQENGWKPQFASKIVKDALLKAGREILSLF